MPGTRILIVGREQDSYQRLSQSLANAGFVVSSARDGQSAAFKLVLHGADLVILDLWSCQPQRCDALTEIRRFSSVPIIGLVEPHETEAALAGLQGGADQIMRQPADVSELQARIRALLRRSRHAPH